ncbi:hypothetical protein D9M73_71740 [compost metagenome]
MQGPGHGHTVFGRQLEVDHRHVGHQRQRLGNGRVATGCRGHHFDVIAGRHQGGQPLADKLMIVGQQEMDGSLRHVMKAGNKLRSTGLQKRVTLLCACPHCGANPEGFYAP